MEKRCIAKNIITDYSGFIMVYISIKNEKKQIENH